MTRLRRTCIRLALALALAIGHLPAGALAAQANAERPLPAPTTSLAAASPAPDATVPVSISTDTTLTNDRVWVATNSVRVRAGATLTIEPGTTIRFVENAFLVIEGALVADGQGGEPILLTADADEPRPGAWGGYYSMTTASILFLPGSAPALLDATGEYVSGSIIRNAVVEYGMGIACRSASPLIEGSTIRHHGGIVAAALAGLVDSVSLASDTAPVIRGNAITDNNVLGLYLSTSEAVVAGNVIARNAGAMALDGAAEISENLITANRAISSAYASNVPTAILASAGSIHGNSVFGNQTSLAFRYTAGESSTMDISGNYWGSTSADEIESMVYHSQDDFTLGTVVFSPFLTEPAPGTPNFLAGVDVTPGDPVGPGLATFTVRFADAMDQSVDPRVVFHLAEGGTWTQYNRENSGLPAGEVVSIAQSPDSTMWFGTLGGGVARFDGKEWLTYTTRNSGLGGNLVSGLAIVDDDELWFSHRSRSDLLLSHLQDGEWEAFSRGECEVDDPLFLAESDLYSFGAIPEPIDGLCDASGIAVDGAGSVFVATYGVMQYDGSTWRLHGPDTGLPEAWVDSVATGSGGSIWATPEYEGLARYDGSSWMLFDLTNSGLPSLQTYLMATGSDGSVWLFTYGHGITKYDGTSWTHYPISDSFSQQGVPSYVYALAVGPSGTLWAVSSNGLVRFDGSEWTYFEDTPTNVGSIAVDCHGNVWLGTSEQGVLVRRSDDPYLVTEDGRWLDDHTWQGTYEVTSLIQRGEYVVTVSNAYGQNGLEMPADSRFSFLIDYPGTIDDFTAPPPPSAYASSLADDPAGLYARWSAADPQSAISLYRYSLGSAPGAADIVAWTQTGDAELRQGGLGLSAGTRYWFSVRARNDAGLWSDPTQVSFIAGGVWPGDVYLPLASH